MVPPRVVVSPDKFKGSLPAAGVAAHVATGLRRAVDGVVVTELPVADGGEGTVEAALAAGFTAVELTATGPLGEQRATRYAVRGTTAVIEMAAVSGLDMVTPDPATARHATSRGVGELVRHALDHGARTIVLGVGGSASTDGGAGMVQALGVRLHGPALDDPALDDPALDDPALDDPALDDPALDDPALDDRALDDRAAGGGDLRALTGVDVTGLDPRLRETDVVLASDVDNPLLGPTGAAAVYGPQKGADAQTVAELDEGLARWVRALAEAGVPDAVGLAQAPGAGAAGGVGYAALTLLGARRRPGVDVVLELTGFAARVRGADLVVTGEGSLDRQSLHGKAPVGVAQAAAAAGVPVVAVCGRLALTPEHLADAGIVAAYALTDLEPDLARCIAEPGPLLERLGAQVAAVHLTVHLAEHPAEHPAERVTVHPAEHPADGGAR
ncbi:glycerate kinase [Cellulomonas fimi]|uniref:Glycerate kinase n=2 Tax=Cellulomonas fimi TaxID=1708 RepID=A0A7Y0M1F4_CELFI|nr:glycerate kinase [Cellulomonas fimi]